MLLVKFGKLIEVGQIRPSACESLLEHSCFAKIIVRDCRIAATNEYLLPSTEFNSCLRVLK